MFSFTSTRAFIVIGWILLSMQSTPASAQEAAELAFGAGVSVPSGAARTGFEFGPLVTAGIGYRPANGVVLRLQSEHHRLRERGEEGSLNVSGGSVNLALEFGEPALRPYLVVGAGLHRLNSSTREHKVSSGMSLGGGLDAPISPAASLYFESRYAVHFADYGTEDVWLNTNWRLAMGFRLRP